MRGCGLPVEPIDHQAEAEFCRRFSHRIRLYGLRHLRTDALADDLVQQVLLLTIQSLRQGRVREPEQIASFVLGSCRMITFERRRGESRRERLLEQYQVVTIAALEGPAELDLERLRACVEKLPTRERTVILLSFYDERTGAEIAATLSMTLGNVRVVRHRALGHLQECMGIESEGRA